MRARLRHGWRLVLELARYVRATGNWWMLPLVLSLVLIMVVIGVVEAAAPFVLYPIF